MLKSLTIQNIAIAKNLHLELGSGLNIITGETGAGKSLLVDSLSLLRGAKVDSGLIRRGEEKAWITGVFSLEGRMGIASTLEEMGIPAQEPNELVIRRELGSNGRHRNFLNDTPVTLASFRQVAQQLVDISSQFENQGLADPRSHTRYLDSFANASGLFTKYRSLRETMKGLLKHLEELVQQQEQMEREARLAEFELEEIETASLSESDYERVAEVVALGRKAELSTKQCQSLLSMLTEAEHSCLEQLDSAKGIAQKMLDNHVSIKLPIDTQNLDAAIAGIEDFVGQLYETVAKLSIDEEELSQAIDRIDTYNRLFAKYGDAVAQVEAYAQNLQNTLEKTGDLKSEIAKTVEQWLEHNTHLQEATQAISQLRTKALKPLGKGIEAILAQLGMPKARFFAELSPPKTEAQEPPLGLEGYAAEYQSFTKMGHTGAEIAEFKLAANPGLPADSLHKVASGGELSRIMLAIKSVLMDKEPINVFVFDEIDTGISGRVAAKVGQKLAAFCNGRQALCITHLPQVASYANQHYIVQKEVKGGFTYSSIRLCTPKERVQEVAKMLAGEEISPESLAQSTALLEESADFHGSL